MSVLKKSKKRTVSRRFRTSVRRRGRRPVPWKQLLIAAVVCAAVIAAAVIIGSVLRKRSDEIRARREADAWTLADEERTARDAAVPDFRGSALQPGGSLTMIASVSRDNGVTIDLSVGSDGSFAYALPMAASAGLTVPDDAISLVSEVQRLHTAGLRVMGVFRVRCLDVSYAADPALSAYRRGIELSLLTACASAGVDELLLVGLPAGTDTGDAQALAFLDELRPLLSSADHTPLVGVSLPPAAFALRPEEAGSADVTALPSADVLYGGSLTPGRMSLGCDFLAMDLRGLAPDAAGELLADIRYAYARFSLHLLYTADNVDFEAIAVKHGFTRLAGTSLPAE